MLGHETVGTAYIRILAEGSGLDESIKREIRKSDDGVRAEGARQGEAYGKEFKKGLSQQKIGEGLRENLEKGQARTDLADRYFNSRDWKRFVGRLKQEYGDEGIVAARELQDKFRHNLGGLEQSTGDIGRMVDGIRDKNQQAADDFEKSWRTSFDKTGNDIQRLRANFAEDFGDIGKNLDDTKTHLRNLATEFDDGNDRMRRWRTEITKGLGVMGRWGHRIEESGGFFAHFLRTARETSPVVTKMRSGFSSFADVLGRAFGKGSRNNFLNFIGSVVGGLVELGSKVLTGVIGFFMDMGKQAKAAFTASQEAGDAMFVSLAKGAGAAALSFAELPVMLAGLAAALVAITIALGPIIGALSLLLGTVIALTASISFGLMGALAPLVGLLAPIAVTAGAVAAAFIGMDTKTKKLMKESLKPLKQDLQDLGDAARPGILRGLQTAVTNLRGPVKQLEPLFSAAGDGIATFMGAFTDAMTGPGFTNFVNIMTQQLPGEMHSLGDALGHVFDGFLGALGSLNRKGGPVEQFLGWLTGITQAFDDWTTMKVTTPGMDLSHAGGAGMKLPSEAPGAAPQTGFDKWMTGIMASAQALKGVLTPLWDIIKTLMNAGKPSGDSMMTGLGQNLQDLSDWLDAHPDDVHQWFLDAEDFASALGTLAKNFALLAAAFDTPGGRATATFLVRMSGLSLGPAAGGVSALASALNPFAGVMSTLSIVPWDKVSGGIDKLTQIKWSNIFGGATFKGVHIPWHEIVNVPAGLGSVIQSSVVKLFSGLGPKVKNALGKVDISAMISGGKSVLGKVTGPFKGLAKQALLAIGTFNIGNIVLGLGSVAKDILHAFPSANEILHSIGTFDIMDVVHGLESVASSIFNAFPSAGEILASIGHIDLGSLMHGSIDPPGPLGPWRWAQGGIVPFPMRGLIGEAGPEAVVPLNRPLHMVDPAVRGLSAIAQGLAGVSGGSTVVMPPTKPTIDASGWTIVTPTKDPSAVASEVINRLVATGY